LPHHSTAIVSAGVDTLTCSAEWNGGVHGLIGLAQYVQQQEAALGSKVMPFKRGPYRGVQTRHVGLGFKPGRVLAELRGTLADEWYRDFLPYSDKVSRVDLQTTVRQQPYDHDQAVRIALGEREAATQAGRPSRFQLIMEPSGGSTLYIGRGASRYQARMYEAEYKHPKQGMEECWRYEIQARRERAQQMADLLVGNGDVQPFVQAAVHSHFARRGVEPIFDPQAHCHIPPLAQAETDAARSLNWLSTSVAPALRRHEAWGTYDRAIKALGIPEP
jgi:Replication initiation factor